MILTGHTYASLNDHLMKILFVHTILDSTSVGRIPLGCLYVSAALKSAGHEVQLVDACDYRRVHDHVRSYRPNIVLYSTVSSFHRRYIELNQRLKQDFPGVYSIFGGMHPTFFPDMVNEQGIDAVCVGEGEEAIVDFVGRMERGQDFTDTPNFWVKHEGQIHANDVRPLIPDIDVIAYPDRDLLAPYPSVRRFGSRSFISSRGCPYNCSYCYNKPFFDQIYKDKGKRVRKRSVDNLVGEMEREMVDCPFEVAQFEDDIFVYSIDWLREFRDTYRRRVGLPFICNMRVELITDDVARVLAEAGCRSVWIGLEAGNERVLKSLLNRRTPNDKTVAAVETLKRHGLNCTLEVMIGLPTTTLDNDLETLDLCIKCQPTYANAHIFSPLPGLELTDLAIQNQEFEGDFDAVDDYYGATSLKLDHASELNNLEHLLSLSVRFPALRPLLPLLLKLPATPLYAMGHRLFKGMTISTKLLPLKPNRYFPLYAYRISAGALKGVRSRLWGD
jgi:anaerobic magnesium-protoporphyrin IX monomethyl ester cyclase